MSSKIVKPPKVKVYVMGSLRNPTIPIVAQRLRDAGYEVFDDWHCAGPNADDHLRDHYKARGMGMTEILSSHAARHVFNFDRHHLEMADVGVLVMPAGKSAHIEAGWMVGRNKPVHVIWDKEPERVDIMYQFLTWHWMDIDECITAFSNAGGHEASCAIPKI